MKNILLATDFSPAAKNATKYALKLATEFGARVTLVTAYEEIAIPEDEAMTVIDNKDMLALAMRQLEQEKCRYSRKEGGDIDLLLKKGPVVRAVLAASEQIKADLIVVGMTGTEKEIRRSFGSAATSLASKTKIPLLVIPEGANFIPPVGIAIADDVSKIRDRQTPELVLQLLQQFHARLYLVRVFNKHAGEVVEIFQTPVSQMQALGTVSALNQTFSGTHVARALEGFVEDNSINILVMRPKPRTITEKWFLRSNTKEMIFETSIPLLIIPENQTDN
jgi:nucleotide-binding universal stress UspA family protein